MSTPLWRQVIEGTYDPFSSSFDRRRSSRGSFEELDTDWRAFNIERDAARAAEAEQGRQEREALELRGQEYVNLNQAQGRLQSAVGLAEAFGQPGIEPQGPPSALEGIANVLDATKSFVVGGLSGLMGWDIQGDDADQTKFAVSRFVRQEDIVGDRNRLEVAWERALKGLFGGQSYGFGDFEKLRYEQDDPRYQRVIKGLGAFTFDVALDPLTYFSFGSSIFGRLVASGSVRAASRRVAVDVLQKAGDDVVRQQVERMSGRELMTRVHQATGRDMNELLIRTPQQLVDDLLAAKGSHFIDAAADSWSLGNAAAYGARGRTGLYDRLVETIGKDMADDFWARLPGDLRGGARIRVPFRRTVDEFTGMRVPTVIAFPGSQPGRGFDLIGMDKVVRRMNEARLVLRTGPFKFLENITGGRGQSWTNVLNAARRGDPDAIEAYALHFGGMAFDDQYRIFLAQFDQTVHAGFGAIKRQEALAVERGFDPDKIKDYATQAYFMRGRPDLPPPSSPEDIVAIDMVDHLFQMTDNAHRLAVEIYGEDAARKLQDYATRMLTKEGIKDLADRYGRLQGRRTRLADATGRLITSFPKTMDIDNQGRLIVTSWMTPDEIFERTDRMLFMNDPFEAVSEYMNLMRRELSRDWALKQLQDMGLLVSLTEDVLRQPTVRKIQSEVQSRMVRVRSILNKLEKGERIPEIMEAQLQAESAGLERTLRASELVQIEPGYFRSTDGLVEIRQNRGGGWSAYVEGEPAHRPIFSQAQAEGLVPELQGPVREVDWDDVRRGFYDDKGNRIPARQVRMEGTDDPRWVTSAEPAPASGPAGGPAIAPDADDARQISGTWEPWLRSGADADVEYVHKILLSRIAIHESGGRSVSRRAYLIHKRDLEILEELHPRLSGMVYDDTAVPVSSVAPNARYRIEIDDRGRWQLVENIPSGQVRAAAAAAPAAAPDAPRPLGIVRIVGDFVEMSDGSQYQIKWQSISPLPFPPSSWVARKVGGDPSDILAYAKTKQEAKERLINRVGYASDTAVVGEIDPSATVVQVVKIGPRRDELVLSDGRRVAVNRVGNEYVANIAGRPDPIARAGSKRAVQSEIAALSREGRLVSEGEQFDISKGRLRLRGQAPEPEPVTAAPSVPGLPDPSLNPTMYGYQLAKNNIKLKWARDDKGWVAKYGDYELRVNDPRLYGDSVQEYPGQEYFGYSIMRGKQGGDSGPAPIPEGLDPSGRAAMVADIQRDLEEQFYVHYAMRFSLGWRDKKLPKKLRDAVPSKEDFAAREAAPSTAVDAPVSDIDYYRLLDRNKDAIRDANVSWSKAGKVHMAYWNDFEVSLTPSGRQQYQVKIVGPDGSVLDDFNVYMPLSNAKFNALDQYLPSAVANYSPAARSVSKIDGIRSSVDELVSLIEQTFTSADGGIRLSKAQKEITRKESWHRTMESIAEELARAADGDQASFLAAVDQFERLDSVVRVRLAALLRRTENSKQAVDEAERLSKLADDVWDIVQYDEIHNILGDFFDANEVMYTRYQEATTVAGKKWTRDGPHYFEPAPEVADLYRTTRSIIDSVADQVRQGQTPEFWMEDLRTAIGNAIDISEIDPLTGYASLWYTGSPEGLSPLFKVLVNTANSIIETGELIGLLRKAAANIEGAAPVPSAAPLPRAATADAQFSSPIVRSQDLIDLSDNSYIQILVQDKSPFFVARRFIVDPETGQRQAVENITGDDRAKLWQEVLDRFGLDTPEVAGVKMPGKPDDVRYPLRPLDYNEVLSNVEAFDSASGITFVQIPGSTVVYRVQTYRMGPGPRGSESAIDRTVRVDFAESSTGGWSNFGSFETRQEAVAAMFADSQRLATEASAQISGAPPAAAITSPAVPAPIEPGLRRDFAGRYKYTRPDGEELDIVQVRLEGKKQVWRVTDAEGIDLGDFARREDAVAFIEGRPAAPRRPTITPETRALVVQIRRAISELSDLEDQVMQILAPENMTNVGRNQLDSLFERVSEINNFLLNSTELLAFDHPALARRLISARPGGESVERGLGSDLAALLSDAIEDVAARAPRSTTDLVEPSSPQYFGQQKYFEIQEGAGGPILSPSRRPDFTDKNEAIYWANKLANRVRDPQARVVRDEVWETNRQAIIEKFQNDYEWLTAALSDGLLLRHQSTEDFDKWVERVITFLKGVDPSIDPFDSAIDKSRYTAAARAAGLQRFEVEGLSPVVSAIINENDLFGPEILAETIKRHFALSRNLDGADKFYQDFWRPYYTASKSWMTQGRGYGYTARNIIGSMYNAWLADVRARHFNQSAAMLAARRKARDAANEILERRPVIEGETTVEAWEMIFDAELRRALREGGNGFPKMSRRNADYVADAYHLFMERNYGGRTARSRTWGELLDRGTLDQPRYGAGGVTRRVSELYGGRYVDELTPIQKALNASVDNAWMRHVTRVNESSEDYLRFAAFLRGADTYGLDDGGFAAGAWVVGTQFDYADLSQFERRLMKNIIPFYTWTRRNVPLQIRSVWMEPGKVNRLLRFHEEVMKAWTGEDKEGQSALPEWLRRRGGWMTSMSSPGQDPETILGRIFGLKEDPIAAFIESPLTDLGMLFNATLNPLQLLNRDEIINNLNPLVGKAAFELVTGRSYTGGRELDSDALAPRWAVPWAALRGRRNEDGELVFSQKWAQFFRNTLPPFAQAERLLAPLFGDERMRRRWLTTMGSQLLAAPLYTVDPNQQSFALNNYAQGIQEALRAGILNYDDKRDVANRLLGMGYTPAQVAALGLQSTDPTTLNFEELARARRNVSTEEQISSFLETLPPEVARMFIFRRGFRGLTGHEAVEAWENRQPINELGALYLPEVDMAFADWFGRLPESEKLGFVFRYGIGPYRGAQAVREWSTKGGLPNRPPGLGSADFLS